MGLLAGCTNLAQIQRYGQFLTHSQRVWLDWPTNKNGKGRIEDRHIKVYTVSNLQKFNSPTPAA